jgi:hypothetical protein
MTEGAANEGDSGNEDGQPTRRQQFLPERLTGPRQQALGGLIRHAEPGSNEAVAPPPPVKGS